MILENLLAIHRLQAHTPTREAVLKLMLAAGRNLADAGIVALSQDNPPELVA